MRYIDHDVDNGGRRGRRRGPRGKGPFRMPPHLEGDGPHGPHAPHEGPHGSHHDHDHDHDHDHGRGVGRGRGRGRAQRGDVRTAIMLVVADEAMHGYQIMQAMSDRTEGAWRPSPGAIYPTIAQLEDEGLVLTREEGGRKLVSLTDEGRAYLTERTERLGDPFAEFGRRPAGPDLRSALQELHGAARQLGLSGTPEQVQAAAIVLADAKRSLYLILAGEKPGE